MAAAQLQQNRLPTRAIHALSKWAASIHKKTSSDSFSVVFDAPDVKTYRNVCVADL